MDLSMEHCCEVGVCLTSRQMTFGSSAVPHLTVGALALVLNLTSAARMQTLLRAGTCLTVGLGYAVIHRCEESALLFPTMYYSISESNYHANAEKRVPLDCTLQHSVAVR